MSEMSAKATTGSVAVAVLLARLWSGVVLVTVAVLLKLVPAGKPGSSLTSSSMVAISPAGSVPRLHVTRTAPAQDPWVGMAETSATTGGKGSLTTTSDASDGPLLVTWITKRWLRPATVGLVSKLLAMATSAEWVTFEVAVEELFARSGSCVGELTVAVLASVPTARLGLVCTTTSTLTDLSAGTVPSEHVTVAPSLAHVPAVGVTETIVVPAGRWSVTVTARASAGPALVTASVYFAMSPATTGFGDAVLMMARSASGSTGVVTAEELLVRSGSCVVESTVAVLVTVPVVDAFTVTWMYTLAAAPARKVPRSHVTVAAALVQGPRAWVWPRRK